MDVSRRGGTCGVADPAAGGSGRAQNPETRPKKIKKPPAPFCHALPE